MQNSTVFIVIVITIFLLVYVFATTCHSRKPCTEKKEIEISCNDPVKEFPTDDRDYPIIDVAGLPIVPPPITDPCASIPDMIPQQIKVVASDGADDDLLGTRVAISGSTIAASAIDTGDRQGSVYIYEKSGTLWPEVQILQASNSADGFEFGRGLAIEGDTLVVGATQDSASAPFDIGAVYIFTRTAGVWSEQAILGPSDNPPNSAYGQDVDISGNTVVVGASEANGGSGAAYVYTVTGGVWSQEAILTAGDAAFGDDYGTSVAIDGDTIVVGANRDDDTVANSGSVYVYRKIGGIWFLEQKINDLAPGADQFGFDVDILGDTLAIGSLRDSDAAVQAGSAQVWTRTGSVWTFQQKFLPDGTVAGEGFGQSVALDEDVLVVGNIFGEDDTPGNFLGKLHVYERDAGVWTETYELLANDGVNNDQLGVSVAVDGPTIVGGTSTHNSFAGAGYIFENYLEACYCNEGVCNQCETDVDCGFGRTCDSGSCV